MEYNSTTQEPSLTLENRTPVCYSCSEKLYLMLRKLARSEQENILGVGGRKWPEVVRDTQQHYEYILELGDPTLFSDLDEDEMKIVKQILEEKIHD